MIRVRRPPPCTLILESVCSLESTQYRRWFSRSGHGRGYQIGSGQSTYQMFWTLSIGAEVYENKQIRTKGDSVWPDNVICNHGGTIASIKTTSLNLGRRTPISPVHEATTHKRTFNKLYNYASTF